MSHIVSIQTEVRDPAAIRAACLRLKLPDPVHGDHQLFADSATGWAIRLPDWRYPVVCQIDSGTVAFDNYGERWGKREELDRFLQAYAIEKATIEARKKGHTVTEQVLTDGAVKLTVQVGGLAAHLGGAG